MTLIQPPEPEINVNDLDVLFKKISDNRIDLYRIALNRFWNDTASSRHADLNTDRLSRVELGTISEAFQFCWNLARSNIQWNWLPTSLPQRGHDGAVRVAGEITIWNEGGAPTIAPIHITAPLVHIHRASGDVRTEPSGPGIIRIGNPGKYEIFSYTGIVVSHLAIRMLPQLAKQDHIRANTLVMQPWRTKAPSTLIAFVRETSEVFDLTVKQMSDMLVLLDKINDPQRAPIALEALPVELTSESNFEATLHNLTQWRDAGGEPIRYFQDVIQPCICPGEIFPIITAFQRSVEAAIELVDVGPEKAPTWEEVSSEWHAHNIVRHQLPSIRTQLMTIMGRLVDSTRQARPDLTISTTPCDSITWSQACDLAQKIGAEARREDGYVYLRMNSAIQQLEDISDTLGSWPFNYSAREIANMTSLRLNLAADPCEE
jgi:hypothetical protein